MQPIKEESALFIYMARALISLMEPGQKVTVRRDLRDPELDDTQHLFTTNGFKDVVIARCEPNHITFERMA